MSQSLSTLFDMKVDFDQSHWFFPKIVMVLLVLLLLWILLSNLGRIRTAISNKGAGFRFFQKDADFFRLTMTLILTPLYFVAMDEIGQLIPNLGMGFLLSSIPFMFLLSLVYLHNRTPRMMLIVAANAVLAPLFVWLLLGQVFSISLP